MIQFEAQPIIIAEAGDDSPRTISGVAVPWNVAATVSDGQTVKFLRGAFNTAAKPAKLLEGHDMSQLRGVVTALADEEDGLHFTARFAKTRAADEAIELVKASAYDAVSVGAVPRKFKFDRDGTMVVSSADLLEISLVAVPAFSAAQITEIAASADPEDDETQPQDTPQEDQVSEEIKAEAPEAPATIPTPLFAEARRPFKLPSAAEYIAAMTRGGSEFAQLNANIKAAAGDVVVSDSVVPEPIVQPLFDDVNPIRPIVSALGARSMPGLGKVFIRPRIKTHAEVGEQTTELTGLATRTLEIEEVQVTKRTYGGTCLLSEQVIDWSDPSMLDALLRDLAGQYALATEADAVATMAANIGSGNREVTDLTDPVEVIQDIYAIAALIAGVGNYLPTHIIVSPSVWAKLGSLVGTNDMPLFPQTAPINGIGTLPGGAGAWNGNPLGLQLVVSNQITTQSVQGNDAKDYLFLANARFMECFETVKGAVSVEVPSTLGRQVSFRGYFSSVIMEENACWALGPAV
jgi:HK97 family phage prohead protease